MSKMYARQIAARGLTPNHRGKPISVLGREATTLVGYEHFEHITVVTIKGYFGELMDVDLEHLEEVTVYD